MGILDAIFGKKREVTNPDNTELLRLLDQYWKCDGKGDTYIDVFNELSNGNSFLIFPTVDGEISSSGDWTSAKKNTTLHLASVVNLDGLKILGAFTDEKSLLNWIGKPTQYTAMRSQDVLEFVESNGMDRIVINSDQPNMFVLERNRENIINHTIEEDTTVQFGTPQRPLNPKTIQQLLFYFKKNDTISEVYQYGQTRNNEYSIVLGIKLSIYNENSKNAAINSIQNALQNEKLDVLLDIFFLESDEWYENIKRVENSLVYIKNGL